MLVQAADCCPPKRRPRPSWEAAPRRTIACQTSTRGAYCFAMHLVEDVCGHRIPCGRSDNSTCDHIKCQLHTPGSPDPRQLSVSSSSKDPLSIWMAKGSCSKADWVYVVCAQGKPCSASSRTWFSKSLLPAASSWNCALEMDLALPKRLRAASSSAAAAAAFPAPAAPPLRR